jgi:hypothetical protein
VCDGHRQPVASVGMKLEVIVIPVSDIDCAKEFYAKPTGLDSDRSVRAGVPPRPVHASRFHHIGSVRHYETLHIILWC